MSADMQTVKALWLSEKNKNYVPFRVENLTNTAQQIKAGAGKLLSFNIINPNTVPVYVKFVDNLIANITVGGAGGVPQNTLVVPPGDGTTPGVATLGLDIAEIDSFVNGIAFFAVTGLADASAAAPGTALTAELNYI